MSDTPITDNPPAAIYLQWHGDAEPSDDPVCITEVTWHWESIFPADIQYIRADLVAAQRDALVDFTRNVAATSSSSRLRREAKAALSQIRTPQPPTP